ncbi:hypothetical protein KKF60_03125 [Patescibacteria group bacterium]|nr:hypothetical protein [Patescibacteria group bacterium]MCG2696147.1 hypothetical protein [Candidatus Portnoybacteria bacterium]
MGTTIEDVQYEMHLQEEWERERKEAFEALEKIANSENISELQENLNRLRDVYNSEIAIDDDNVKKLVSELDFSMPKMKEYLDKRDKKSFYINILINIMVAAIGLIAGHLIF